MKIAISRVNSHGAKIVDRADAQPRIASICAIKLDHIGDFVMALPAVQTLRKEFPGAKIDLVCASWNIELARSTGLFDQIHGFDFLPANPSKSGNAPRAEFPQAVADKRYDLAIDLRVHEETRPVLSHIAARWYAAIGQAVPGNANVIVLPRQTGEPGNAEIEPQSFIPVDRTAHRQPGTLIADEAMIRFTQFKKHDNLLVIGPLTLPVGTYRASFLCTFEPGFPTRRPIVILAAFADDRCLTEQRLFVSRHQDPYTIEFHVPHDTARIDVRMRIRRGRFARIDYRGLLVHQISPQAPQIASDAETQSPRRHLHIAEQLLLLASLVSSRLNGVSFSDRWRVDLADDLTIAVAPFSNSAIRDWPIEHYEALIVRLEQFYRPRFVLLGSAGQQTALLDLARCLQESGVRQVAVEAGKSLSDVAALLSRAALVISNNSGIAHMAGAFGRPVVAIYSASHDVDEWGAVGSHVWLIQAEIACQRCHLDFVDTCRNDRRCTRDLLPDVVFGLILGRVAWPGNEPRFRQPPLASGSIKNGSSARANFPIAVSILIPVHNKVELTRACLDSVFATADARIPVEIIVTDDCSSDATADYLASLGERIRVISNPARRCFGENMNQAAREARGEFLCLLNNDTIVTPGWLGKLVEAARKDPSVGIVGNLQITPATSKIDHAGIVFDQGCHAHHLYRGMEADYPPAHLTREFQMVTGACWLLPRELFIAMGGFDPAFKNGFEDADFCLRVRQLGRKVLYVGDSMIYHHGASSPGRMDHEMANLQYFLRKWRGQIEPDLDDFLRRDQSYLSRHGGERS